MAEEWVAGRGFGNRRYIYQKDKNVLTVSKSIYLHLKAIHLSNSLGMIKVG